MRKLSSMITKELVYICTDRERWSWGTNLVCLMSELRLRAGWVAWACKDESGQCTSRSWDCFSIFLTSTSPLRFLLSCRISLIVSSKYFLAKLSSPNFFILLLDKCGLATTGSRRVFIWTSYHWWSSMLASQSNFLGKKPDCPPRTT